MPHAPWRDSEKVTHHWSYCQRSQPPLNHTAASGHTRPSPTAGNAQKYLFQGSSCAPRQWKAELSQMKEAEEAWQLDAPSWAGSAASQGAPADPPAELEHSLRVGQECWPGQTPASVTTLWLHKAQTSGGAGGGMRTL